jgi:hypothetical protein
VTTIPLSSSIDAIAVPLFSDAERAALAGFLAGYSGQRLSPPSSPAAHCWCCSSTATTTSANSAHPINV